MIARHSFTREWILKQKDRYPKADPLLIERQIYAFELLGLLANSRKSFLFKGGTALLLLLPVARRISIDIDIVGAFTFDELVPLVEGSIFQRVEEHEREKRGIPKRHFKFHYTSVVDGHETYVLLDVLDTSHAYPKIISHPVVNDLFAAEAEVSVTTPTINGITGDKLNAFAPHTLGVPYGKGKSMEIIKQLFDVGDLFNHVTDIAELAAAYKGIWKEESSFRDQKFTVHQTLEDTIDTAFLLSQARFKGSIDSEEVRELLKGVGQLKSYFLGTKFTVDEARVAAGKVALLATMLKGDHHESKLDEMRFGNTCLDQIKGVTLEGRLQILNKLKGTNPEAFYYWWLVQNLELRANP
jgi:hypothetical protein